MATTMVDYAKRLQKAMDDAAVNATALGAAIGVTRQAVRKVLDGPSDSFKLGPHYKAARFLNVRPEWLALGEEPMRPTERETVPADAVDYRTLALMIIAEHPDTEARDLLLQLIDHVDTKVAQLRQVAGQRAVSHTP